MFLCRLSTFGCLAVGTVIVCSFASAVSAADSKEIRDRVFTESELAQHDGSDPDKPIYLSIKGVVYDVSTGKGFYAKGSEYNVLVGRDSTVAIAKMSLEPEDLALKNDVSGLNERQLSDLEEVITTTYVRKYPILGRLVFDNEAVTQNRVDL